MRGGDRSADYHLTAGSRIHSKIAGPVPQTKRERGYDVRADRGGVLGFVLASLLFGGASGVRAGEESAPAGTGWGRADALIGEALEAVLLTEEDLFIRRDYVPVDRFRLEIVSRLLEHPLEADAYVRALARDLEESRGSMGAAVAEAARPLGVSPGEEADYPADMGAALRELAEVTGGEISEERVERWTAEAGDLPDALSEGLAILIAGAVQAYSRLASAFRRLEKEEREELLVGAYRLMIEETESEAEAHQLTKQILAQAERVDFEELIGAGALLGYAVDQALARLETGDGGRGDQPGGADARSGHLLSWETPLGPVVVGGTGPDRYGLAPFITIDLGGADFYSCDEQESSAAPRAISVLIDLSGDDTYRSGPFSQGAAHGGIAVLADLAGDDVYQAEDFAQGAALFGVGLLWEREGDDTYLGGTEVQGAATFGIGILADLEGDDFYRARFLSQGFGGVAACGAVIEGGGNDTYLAGHEYPDHREPDYYACLSQGFGYGIRDISSGGVGVIADVAGNDSYVADYFAQGSSYWFALGALVDAAGNDKYIARRYSQGAGIHLSVGVLSEREGNDDYLSWGVSQGCGHDLAVGLLVDDEGDDSYLSNWLSQGAGNSNGFGMLIDQAGDDTYLARPERSQGYGHFDRDYESVGLLIDADGDDYYSGSGDDGAMWGTGAYGVGLDHEAEPDSGSAGGE
jgi:hypothetical protein